LETKKKKPKPFINGEQPLGESPLGVRGRALIERSDHFEDTNLDVAKGVHKEGKRKREEGMAVKRLKSLLHSKRNSGESFLEIPSMASSIPERTAKETIKSRGCSPLNRGPESHAN